MRYTQPPVAYDPVVKGWRWLSDCGRFESRPYDTAGLAADAWRAAERLRPKPR